MIWRVFVAKNFAQLTKANVIETTEMWREVVSEIGIKEYPDITLSHMYVDNASMQLVRNPKQFDVMLTGNMFGDILSDTASMLTGSLGMLPSASLALNKRVENSFPLRTSSRFGSWYCWKNIANPLATILSLAMMFKYSFALEKRQTIEKKAVENVFKFWH